MTEARVTMVTGASQGIGRALAVAFGEVGDTVVLAARNREGLEETSALVEAAGGRGLPLALDVTDPSSVAAMSDEVGRRFGAVDVLVNNSGVGGPSGVLWETEERAWVDTFEVNVHGVFRVTRALLPAMVARGSGSVIMIGSISGKRPLYGRTPYTSSKLALVGMTRTLALEAGGHGIRVNLISPGFVSGPRLEWVIGAQATARQSSEEAVREEMAAESPLHRLTEATDVAAAAVFLASTAAAGITGADVNVNSGAVMY